MLNKIIHEIRRVQDFMIKLSSKSKISNAITKKLKTSKNEDRYEVTSRPSADDKSDEDDDEEDNDHSYATSRPKTDDRYEACCEPKGGTKTSDI
jgi:(p)ppGpp synthase/HD superfamily hydrolase